MVIWLYFLVLSDYDFQFSGCFCSFVLSIFQEFGSDGDFSNTYFWILEWQFRFQFFFMRYHYQELIKPYPKVTVDRNLASPKIPVSSCLSDCGALRILLTAPCDSLKNFGRWRTIRLRKVNSNLFLNFFFSLKSYM